MQIPEKIKTCLGALWRFPLKGVAVLLLGVLLFEGDTPRNAALPAGFALLVSVAFVLLFFDRGAPAKLCAALVMLSLLARENYPLSHFPMYDRFTDHTFYVYVLSLIHI